MGEFMVKILILLIQFITGRIYFISVSDSNIPNETIQVIGYEKNSKKIIEKVSFIKQGRNV